MPSIRAHRWTGLLLATAALLASAVAADAAPAASPPGTPTPVPAPAPAPAPTWVRYNFDHGWADTRNALPLHVVNVGGGVSMMARGTGRAVRFPAPCVRYAAPSCPRAFLQSGPAGFLNPRTGPIRFGADVLMAAGETSKGGNVVQKGYSVAHSQFKMQVDGYAGDPSCVLVGVGSSRIYAAVADRTVANGRWHRVDCARTGSSLTVAVDGVIVGLVAIPTTLSVYNADPLRVGAKGGSANNDQFNGAVDNVYVQVLPQ